MVDFKALKKNSSLERLAAEVDKLNNPEKSYEEDNRFWQPTVDKTGNGYAVIRFLPAPAVDGDDALPWIRIFRHGFKGPTNLWYIENNLTTIGLKDPVSELNSELWNASQDDKGPERSQARAQKRKLTYTSNILVVDDPENPANNDKIFLFNYGKKIFDKINAAMHPEFKDETPLNPFDLWEGANFKLKIRQVEGYRNYDKSEFEKPSAVPGDDKRLENIWKSEFSLKEFLAPDKFKSYEELKAKLDKVLAKPVTTAQRQAAENAVEAKKPAASRKPAPVVDEVVEEVAEVAGDEDDADLAYFKKLAAD